MFIPLVITARVVKPANKRKHDAMYNQGIPIFAQVILAIECLLLIFYYGCEKINVIISIHNSLI
jgi:glycopeptide antibiotics resistance protein